MTLMQTIVKQADELVRTAEMPISQWVKEQNEKRISVQNPSEPADEKHNSRVDE